jgi:hypothetical protein
VNPESSVTRAFGTDSSTTCEAVFFKRVEGIIAKGLPVGNVRVAIDQSGKHGLVGKIDYRSIARKSQRRPQRPESSRP